MAGGRPALFNSVEELDKKIEEYYIYIQGEGELKTVTKTAKDGSVTEYEDMVWKRNPETPTITGLALFLGFESRQSLYDYEKNGEFSYSIKKAKLHVEKSYEQHLLSQSATGAIFALKNFGWADKQEIDHTTKGQSINGKDLSKLTDEELRQMSEIEKKLNA